MLQSTAVVLLAMFWASLYLLDSFIKVALTGVPTFSYSSVNDYTVSQKKTSPTFLAITRESIVGFLSYLAHMLPRK